MSDLVAVIIGPVFSVVIVISIALIVVTVRKGSSAIHGKPANLLKVAVPISPSDAIKAVILAAQQFGYKIDYIDETRGHIVLSDNYSLTTWGHFYPIYITAKDSDCTVIEVGVKSRLSAVKQVMASSHERCFYAIKATFMLR